MSEQKGLVKWEEEMAKHAKAIAKNERPSVSRISLKGGIMTLMDQKVPGNRLPAIILGYIVEHAYYPRRFDANKIEAPDCFAFSNPADPDDDGKNLVPHEKAFLKQSENCTSCPMFQWGSDTNSSSGKGKACKERRKLVLMPAGSLNDIARAEFATVDVPVTSVKNWKKYVNMLSATVARPPWGVVTTLQLEPDPRTQIKLDFNYEASVEDKYLGDIFAKLQPAYDILTIPYEKTESGLKEGTQQMMSGRKY